MNRHNSCFVVGNLGMDPIERGRTPNGVVVKFSVAENVSRFNEEKREFETLHTNWFQVTAFSPLAERALQLKKGERVAIQGRMKVSKFTDRAGEERLGFEILADEVALWKALPAQGLASGASIAAPQAVASPAAEARVVRRKQPPQAAAPANAISDEAIPF